MPTDTPKKANRETWQDPPWTHPDESPQFNVLTRNQLIERVQENGFEVSTRDLIFWESEGILPRAVKQRHQGATRAVYPHWMTYYVVTLRELQRAGRSLEAIAEELRRPFHRALSRAYGHGFDPAAGDAVFHSGRLGVAVLAEMRELSRRTGRELVRAEIRFFDRSGNTSHHPMEVRLTGLDGELQLIAKLRPFSLD